MLKLSLFSILIALPLVLAGCPNSGKAAKNKSGPSIQKVKGDPMVFVNGTQMNRRNQLSMDLLAEDKHYSLGVSGFVEEKQEAPKENIETGNEAPTRQGKAAADELEKNVVVTKFTREGDVITASNGFYKATFKVDSATNTFKIIGIAYKENGKVYSYKEGEFEVLHTSVSSEHQAFTFLLAGTEAPPKGRYVVSIGFYPPLPVKESVFTLDNFYYIYGVGVKIIWPQDKLREVRLCHPPSPEVSNAFKQALGAWNENLKGRFELTTTTASSCPPFSDLNTQTATVLDGWIEIEGQQGQSGITKWFVDAPKGEILDADIFVYRSELAENYGVYRPGKDVTSVDAAKDSGVYAFYFETFQHELGHLLGLHHQFNKDVKSVMGYDSSVKTLQPYDIQAIQALYPLKNPSGR
jgi:hypothetical protein